MKVTIAHAVALASMAVAAYLGSKNADLRQDLEGCKLGSALLAHQAVECRFAVEAAGWANPPGPNDPRLTDSDIVALIRRDLPKHAAECLK